ncbi:hypothetical protein [Sulfuricurvum sp.]|uniref:hypothetical protein n=1 Tax=Sulfuricurvum sp. TaxID=2025608 RepID=UPI003BB4A927
MKNKNTFLKVLKERYLSLIVIPIVILSGLFIYANVNGILLNNDWEHSLLREENFSFFLEMGVALYFLIAFFKILFQWVNLYFTDAFGEVIRFIVILVIFTVGNESSNFTQKIENFQKEKRYYLHQIEVQGSVGRDRKEKLVGFDTTGSDGNFSCQVHYDESDTLLDPVNDHRELGAFQTLHVNNKQEKIGQIPIKVTKIEPNFYYVCRDYDHKIMFNTTTKDKK